jgi:hypothetical protein
MPIEVNLQILITVKGKLQKMQTPFFKTKKDIMNGERWLTRRMTFSIG